MKNCFKSMLLSFCLIMVPVVEVVAKQIEVGVLANRGVSEAIKRWIGLGNYLSNELGVRVKIRTLRLSNVIPAAKDKTVDFILANPVQTLIMREKYAIKPLATLHKKSGTQFAGVIVSKKGSGITKGEHLKGKKVISMKHRVAAGGYLFQAYHLHQSGIEVHKDFATFGAGSKQDFLVMLVKNGQYDAAFIRTGILESMSKAGKISMDDFEIVDKKNDSGISLVHSTALYPEWFFSAISTTSDDLGAKMQAALLKISPASKVAKDAKINGFVKPLSLDGLKYAMKTLKLPPFDK